jgi:hypothetical protein
LEVVRLLELAVDVRISEEVIDAGLEVVDIEFFDFEEIVVVDVASVVKVELTVLVDVEVEDHGIVVSAVEVELSEEFFTLALVVELFVELAVCNDSVELVIVVVIRVEASVVVVEGEFT